MKTIYPFKIDSSSVKWPSKEDEFRHTLGAKTITITGAMLGGVIICNVKVPYENKHLNSYRNTKTFYIASNWIYEEKDNDIAKAL